MTIYLIKKMIFISSSLLLAGLLTACGAKGSQKSSLNQKQEITWLTSAETPTADSVKEYDTVSTEQIDFFGEGLYKIDGKNDAQPALAAGNPIALNKAKTKYVVNLKKGLKWSNGSMLTAHDFVYAWRRLFNPKTAAQNANVYYDIKNAEKINLGKKPVNSLGVKALSNTKLELTLERRDPYLKETLASENLFPQDAKTVEKYGKKYGTSSSRLVADGPFIMKGWSGTNLNWRYVKNPYYWDKKNVHLDKINVQVSKDPSTGVKLFQAKKADNAILSGYFVKQFKKNPDFKSILTLSMSNLEFGTSSNKNLQNVNLRKAISLSLNRQELVGDVLSDGSRAATGVIPKGLAKSPKDKTDLAVDAGNLLPYSTKEAKQLWRKAQQQLHKKTVHFTLLTDDTAQAKNTGEFVQSQIESKLPGVKITLQSLPAQTRFTKMMTYKFDMALAGWSGDIDPFSMLQQFYSTFPHNHAKFNDKYYDQLLNKIQYHDLNNLNTRWSDLLKAQKYLLSNQQVVVPLYQSSSDYLINPKLKGIVTHNLGTPIDLTHAYLSK